MSSVVSVIETVQNFHIQCKLLKSSKLINSMSSVYYFKSEICDVTDFEELCRKAMYKSALL